MGSEGTAKPGFVIRALNSAVDAGQAAEILQAARAAASWSVDALRETVKLPGVLAFVSERQGAVSGIVVGRQVLDEAEILNLAVSEATRRQGEGRALVGHILNRFAEFEVSRVFLEVRESNARAIAFYRGLGFKAIGTRPGYYQEPKESATVMELWLRKFTT
jgi:ribosomal-protein-alanine acetyltransferase